MADIEEAIIKSSPYYLERKEAKKKGVDVNVCSAQFNLVYDSSSETLEPIYFWLLDFMNGMFGGKVTKIVDNFASSPGSGHFGEMGQKMSVMQQQAMTMLGSINTVLKSVINLIYDLKEFQIRLNSYDIAKSKNKDEAEAGILSLKQMWMDMVDMKRGQGSINALASGQLQFVTLRDAFMKAKSLEDVEKMDLNDRVKRILKPRMAEFLDWKERSEHELRKRYEIEKNYLKGQINTLKLYSKWAKPYLVATQKLSSEGNLGDNPALVNIFNTLMLELCLMGESKLNIESSVISGDLPKNFKDLKSRAYYSLVFVDFKFRGIPSKAGQHYVFGGRAEVTFKAYALNEDELMLFKKELEKNDLNDTLKLIQGITDDSLKELNEDIELLIGEKKPEKKEEKKKEESMNIFSLSFWKGDGDKPKTPADKLKELKEKGIPKEKYHEKYMRSLAEANAKNSCFTVYDVYKKAHGMAAFPYNEEASASAPRSKAEEFFGFE